MENTLGAVYRKTLSTVFVSLDTVERSAVALNNVVKVVEYRSEIYATRELAQLKSEMEIV